MEEHTTIAVDLSKTVFEVAVSHKPGRVAERRRLSRRQLIRFFAGRRSATVLMEACGSSHHWARQIERLGHRVLLLPPQHTRRYVLRDKPIAPTRPRCSRPIATSRLLLSLSRLSTSRLSLRSIASVPVGWPPAPHESMRSVVFSEKLGSPSLKALVMSCPA